MSDQENTNTPEKKKFKFNFIPVIGAVVGAIGGYIYYLEIGCSSGSCGITSNPYMSMLWGAALGYLVFDIFTKRRKKKSDS